MKLKDVIINLSQMIKLMTLWTIKTFNLILNREKRIKFAFEVKKHIDEYVVFEELKISNQRVQTKKDSRVYFTNEMWRDIVKKQLQLIELKMNLLTMKIQTSIISIQTLLIYNFNNSDATISWTKIQILLKSDMKKFDFIYILRVLNSDDEDNDCFEYREFSLILMNEIHLSTDLDVHFENEFTKFDESITKSVRTDEESSKMFFFELSIKDSKEIFRKFLSKHERLKRKVSISQSHFDDHELMLRYHDNYDVFTNEELQKWKHYVLNIVCDQILKSSKEIKIIDMKKNVHEKLQTTQTKNEITLISADINHKFSYWSSFSYWSTFAY
jgi:hypothetical protein